MISFFKNKKDGNEFYFPITTDIHSHILPQLDDGSTDVETSILLIKGLMSAGIKKSIATPHIIGDIYRNNADTINHSLSILKNELKKREIDFEVSAAAEYMLDSYFYDLLENKKKLLTLKNNMILTEFSYSTRPEHLEKMSFQIFTEGYQPILAHPERYGYFHNDFEIYQRLKDLGFMLQLNLLSLTGYYGKDVAKAAFYIIKNDLASFVATDLHHERHLDALKDLKFNDLFKKLLSHKEWNTEF